MNARKLVLFLILVFALTSPMIGSVMGQQATRDADLGVQQEHYVQSDVEESTVDNGTVLYNVGGPHVDVKPQNFDSDAVVDYGIVEAEGSVQYQSEMDVYRVTADGEGTYTVYWIVETDVAVEDGEGNNTTAVTETREVRYEAAIRFGGSYVDGPEVVPPGSLEETQRKAEIMESVERELSRLGYYDSESDDLEQTMDHVISRYHLYTSTFTALTGGYTGVIILLITSVGGLLVLLKFSGYHTYVTHRMKKRLNLYESTEQYEGEVSERIKEQDEKEKLNTIANWTWYDIFTDEHVARAFTEEFGERVLHGWNRFGEYLLPDVLLHDRVQVMGQNGWNAIVHRDDGEITSVELVDGEPETDAEVDDLSNPSMELVEAIEDTTPIRDFDLAAAEYDPDKVSTSVPSMELEELVDELNMQTQRLDDDEWGEYLWDFADEVREHPDIQPDGTPDPLRLGFANFLDSAKILEAEGHPVAQYLVDALEAAVTNYDPVEKSREQQNARKRGETE